MANSACRERGCFLRGTTLAVASCLVISTAMINVPVIREARSIPSESEFVGWPFVYAKGIIIARSSVIGPLYSPKYTWTLQPFFRVIDVNAMVANVASILSMLLGTVLVVASSFQRRPAVKQFSLNAVMFLVTATAIFTAICSGARKQCVLPGNAMLPSANLENSTSSLGSLQWWQVAAFVFVSFGITCTLLAALRIGIRLLHGSVWSPSFS